MQKKNRRTKLIIFPKFQMKLILGCLIPYLIICLIFCYKVRVSLDAMQEMWKAIDLPVEHPYFDTTFEMHKALQLDLIYSSLFGLFIAIILLTLISHKLAGPIYRLKRQLHEMNGEENSTEKITFRKKDYLKEIESDLNQLISRK